MQIVIRLLFLIVPIIGLYFLVVYNYNPHARCDGDEHRHTMGPMFGFVIYSIVLFILWLIGISIELILRRYSIDRKKYLFISMLFILIILMLMFFF